MTTAIQERMPQEVAPATYYSSLPSTDHEQSRRAQMGDLATYDHATTVNVINRALGQYHRLHEEKLAEGYFPQEVLEKAEQLDNGIVKLRETLTQAKESEAYKEIRTKYEEADRESVGKSSEERLAHRLSKFKRIHIVTDFDGTLTQDPNSYLMRIPGSRLGEKMLADHGRESFAYAAALSWLHPLEKTPDAFHQVGQEVVLRNGVREFIQTKEDTNVEKITVLSANFEPIVMGGLDQLGKTADGIEVIAVTPNDIRSTDKGTVLSLLAMQDKDTAIIFIGDGSSDEAALAAHGVVAGFGALKGEGFARQLHAANEDGLVAPHFTYSDFDEVGVKLKTANTRVALLQTAA